MSKRLRPTLLIAALAAAGCGADADAVFCADDTCGFNDTEWARLVSLADLPDAPPVDTSNTFERIPEVQSLGQAFYFDTRFSGVATQVDAVGRPSTAARAPKGEPLNISCATCHDLARVGIDDTSVPGNVSAGAGWTDVNALAVVNSSYHSLYFSNGRADSQWALAAAVAESGTTMNGNRLRTAWVIRDAYLQQYEALFGPLPPELVAVDLCTARQIGQPPVPLNGKPGSKPGCQYGDPTEPFNDAWDCLPPELQESLTRVLVNWAKAIAAFESRLTSVRSAFDKFMDEGSESTAIDARARWGARLFVGKAACFDCHNTPFFSDDAFHNVGVPQAGFAVPTLADCPAGASCDCTGAGNKCLPWGAYDGLTRLKTNPWLRSKKWSDDVPDGSPADDLPVQLDESLKGAWRTPTLRNIAFTAPYMHDGLYATLEEVVDHYDRGGDAGAVGTRAAGVRPLGLTADERAALVAFLRTLTGEPLAVEKRTKPVLPTGSVCQ